MNGVWGSGEGWEDKADFILTKILTWINSLGTLNLQICSQNDDGENDLERMASVREWKQNLDVEFLQVVVQKDENCFLWNQKKNLIRRIHCHRSTRPRVVDVN